MTKIHKAWYIGACVTGVRGSKKVQICVTSFLKDSYVQQLTKLSCLYTVSLFLTEKTKTSPAFGRQGFEVSPSQRTSSPFKIAKASSGERDVSCPVNKGSATPKKTKMITLIFHKSITI